MKMIGLRIVAEFGYPFKSPLGVLGKKTGEVGANSLLISKRRGT